MAAQAPSRPQSFGTVACVRNGLSDLRPRMDFGALVEVDRSMNSAMKTPLIDSPGVAELSEAQALGACDPRGSVQVQVLPPGPRFSNERSVLTLDRSGE